MKRSRTKDSHSAVAKVCAGLTGDSTLDATLGGLNKVELLRLAGIYGRWQRLICEAVSADLETANGKRKCGCAVRDSAGTMAGGDFWIKLGLTRAERLALKYLSTLPNRPADRRVAQAARRVLRAGLSHWNELKGWDLADQKYAADEGFWTTEFYTDGLIRDGFGLAPSALNRRDGQSGRNRQRK